MIATSLSYAHQLAKSNADMTTYHLTAKSNNAKTGPIPVSTTSSDTCPTTCPFYGKGCYAKSGPLAMHWRKVDGADRGGDLSELLEQIERMPADQLWRHNQAGDLPGADGTIDSDALAALVAANDSRRGFTYTHKPMTAANQAAVIGANENGFTINLSGNNPAHADTLADLDIAPVVTVLPMDAAKVTHTPAGRRVVTCPATYQDNVNCADCGLCQRQRDYIIGFPAHGTSRKAADLIARQG